MKTQFSVIASLIVACSAIISQPPLCTHPNVCASRVITSCPRKNAISDCPTCCCKSSENVEFYDREQAAAEPWCTAPPAVYSVKFVGTWTGVCQPDYYPRTAHWSPPTGASHNTSYQMWDACMDGVSPGVAQVSQVGATRIIESEYRDAGESIHDTFKAGGILGSGVTSRELRVDKFHQWVSTVTMLAPSRDRMVGVADLRLCDGYDWKKSVKVCSELFSTATRSERVYPPMLRNTIQANNCSFGYFEFTFQRYEDASQVPPSDCEHDGRDVCPPVEDQPQNCRTCCCTSSDNVEFYHPNSPPRTVCGASENAQYKVSLVQTISAICHLEYPFVGGRGPGSAYFSDLLIASHVPSQLIDTCSNDFYDDVFNYLVDTEEVLSSSGDLFTEDYEDIIHDYHLSPDALERGNRRRRSAIVEVSPTMSHVTLISKLLPSGSDNQWVGFSGLNLCGPDGWKDTVDVCLPLLAAFNRTESPAAETKLQKNYCSFAHARLELRTDTTESAATATCRPRVVRVLSNIPTSMCCNFEFIIEGQIIRVTERHGDSQYSDTLTVRVMAVEYDDIGQIEVGDVVSIKVCRLPFRIKFKRTYHLAGSRECGSNELEISENGIIGTEGSVGENPCPAHIFTGNCDA